MIKKTKPRGRPFTKEYQPTKKGDVGRKTGKKIGSIQIYKYLEDKNIGIESHTLLNSKQFLELAVALLMVKDNDLAEINKDEDAPKILKMIVKELITTNQSLDSVFKILDRLTKMQGIESEPLQLNYLIRNIKEVQDAEN